MIPDYLTFIRFQDKRNLLFIYIITLILLGFYWKNAGFTFSKEDIWPVSSILALVLYSFIADLKAYWAYKCVVKNVDLTCFLKKDSRKMSRLICSPFAIVVFAVLMFSCLTWILLYFIPPRWTLLILVILGPVIIWAVFARLRPVYITQVITSARDTVKYKRISSYLAIAMTMSVIMNLLTIAPLRHSEQFNLYGRYFTIESIITMLVLCAVVLVINLLFLRFTKRYIFFGHLLMNEINSFFSTFVPCRYLNAKPLWLRLIILCSIELFWVAFIAMLVTLTGWSLWFEVYFLLCYLPCLVYYTLHTWWKWHNDFMMACDMCLRWDEISQNNALW